ncbi:MAG TPA: hypothetical protein VLA87_11650, partial [Gaiellaceae bacterium]|nr:hypothetical protein [Gaiellaceae bacterium]
EAGRAAAELVRLWLDEGRGLSLGSFWLADLAFALAELDRAAELTGAAARARTRTRWLDAAEAVAERDWPRVAGVFAGIGSRPDEALARVKAAAALEAAGRSAEADEQLRRAAAFLEAVGAAAQTHASTR